MCVCAPLEEEAAAAAAAETGGQRGRRYPVRARASGERRRSAQVSAFSEEAISFIGSDHCLLTRNRDKRVKCR